jgi:hypothetical protein
LENLIIRAAMKKINDYMRLGASRYGKNLKSSEIFDLNKI